MPPRISFCIPTANRASDLDRCFWSIYAEAVHHGVLDRIEVCVADNFSSDPTPARCAEWSTRIPNFRLSRQPTRRDFISNLLDATALATGDFVWLFGDDDSLVPGVLGSVLAAVDSAPSFVHVAAMAFSRAGGGGGLIGVTCPITEPVSALYASDLPQAAWAYISCLVFARKTWMDSPRHAEREPVEVTAHIQVVADCLAAGSCLALHVPGVLIDKTPSRVAAWNGSWTVVLGYEFLKARTRRFPASPSCSRALQYPVPSFIQCFAVLSLLRDHFCRLYSLAAALPATAPLDVIVQKFFGALFSPAPVRMACIALLNRISPKFRSRLALISNQTT